MTQDMTESMCKWYPYRHEDWEGNKSTHKDANVSTWLDSFLGVRIVVSISTLGEIFKVFFKSTSGEGKYTKEQGMANDPIKTLSVKCNTPLQYFILCDLMLYIYGNNFKLIYLKYFS